MEEEGSGEDVHVEIKDLEKVLYGESYNGILTARVSLEWLIKITKKFFKRYKFVLIAFI